MSGIRHAKGYGGSDRRATTRVTRALWAQLGRIYTALEIAFGFGLWKSAGRNRAMQIVGGLILAHASLGFLWPFASMHQREVLASAELRSPTPYTSLWPA